MIDMPTRSLAPFVVGTLLALCSWITPAPALAADWRQCDGHVQEARNAADLSAAPTKAERDLERRLAACDSAVAEIGEASPLRLAHLLRARAALHIALNHGSLADADLARGRTILSEAGLDAEVAAELRHAFNIGRLLRGAMDLKTRPSSRIAGEAFAETNPFDLPKLQELATLASIDPALAPAEREIYSQMFRINPLDMRRLIDALSWSGAHSDASAYWQQHLRIYETYPAPEDAAASPAPYRRFPLVHRAEQLSSAMLDLALGGGERRTELFPAWAGQLVKENAALRTRLDAFRKSKDPGIGAAFVLDELGRIALADALLGAIGQISDNQLGAAQASLFRSSQCNVLAPGRCVHPAQQVVARMLLERDFPGKDAKRLAAIPAMFEPAAIIRRNFEPWDGEKILATMTRPVARSLPEISVAVSNLEAASGALPGATPILLTAQWKVSASPAHRKMAMLLAAARTARQRSFTHLMPVWTTPDHGLTEKSLTDHPERLAEQHGDAMIVVLLNLADVPDDKKAAVASVALSAADAIAHLPGALLVSSPDRP